MNVLIILFLPRQEKTSVSSGNLKGTKEIGEVDDKSDEGDEDDNFADDTDDVEDNTDYGDDGGEGVELFVTVKISERPVDANECPTREESKETERSKHP